jgi:hypothetical protein
LDLAIGNDIEVQGQDKDAGLDLSQLDEKEETKF